MSKQENVSIKKVVRVTLNGAEFSEFNVPKAVNLATLGISYSGGHIKPGQEGGVAIWFYDANQKCYLSAHNGRILLALKGDRFIEIEDAVSEIETLEVSVSGAYRPSITFTDGNGSTLKTVDLN